MKESSKGTEHTHPLEEGFDIHSVLHHLRHYLPAQAPLKDFIHHNTLHAFQNLRFDDALRKASGIFGYKVLLSLNEYRQLYEKRKIRVDILEDTIAKQKGDDSVNLWKKKLLEQDYSISTLPRVGLLRAFWKTNFQMDLDSMVHPTLFRILCSYLDQGISIWNFPVWHKGFLSSLREMEAKSFSSFFRTKRARQLLLNGDYSVESLLRLIVGNNPALFEQYLFDQQFAHQGWSGVVSVIEDHPETLLDPKNISLEELITFELLLELDALEYHFGKKWQPLTSTITEPPAAPFAPLPYSELHEVLTLWQLAFEFSYYDSVLAALQKPAKKTVPKEDISFQALFCIDDRECSLRRYIENLDGDCETFGTPGFFGVEFYFKPEYGKFNTKLCPAPVTPKYLVKEIGNSIKRKKDIHFTKHTHSLFGGWLIAQTLGFWSAFRLFLNIFKPSLGPATATSFNHMDKVSSLTVEHKHHHFEDGLQVGFTVEEMATRVENLLKSIGMVSHFSSLIYVVGHGSSSVNNPFYAAYDCGACSGRPGSVNARVLSAMANHQQVRQLLAQRGINIPDETQFIGALHDTTRDEIAFYDEEELTPGNRKLHRQNERIFEQALDLNAKERSRRFDTIDTRLAAEKIHDKVKLRSVSLFETRPELNHATNALCVVGRRSLTRNVFLDRRSFMNSFDYQVDPEGKYLLNILKAAAPVCGGINLEYFFSRVDNQKLGAGTKLPHNVMGLFGVANGIDGDLRPGLPSQMIEIHDPVRLMIIVEHFPEVVLNTIQQSAETYEWFINEWVHLAAVHPENRSIFLFKNGTFHLYQPLQNQIGQVDNMSLLIEQHTENIPVHQIA
jgi:hypothetical protein